MASGSHVSPSQRLYLLFLANPRLTSDTSCHVLVIQSILHSVTKYCSIKYVLFRVISQMSPALSESPFTLIIHPFTIHPNEGLASLEGFVFLAPMKEPFATRI